METRRLLRNARHRAIITPVNPLRTRLIHISPSYKTIYRSFEIILKRETSIGLEFKMFYANPLFQKNIQSDMH